MRPPPPYELAGFGARFAAYFVDSLILGAITFPLTFYLEMQLMQPMSDPAVPPNQILGSILWIMAISAILDFAVLIIYFTIQEGGKRNATLGKRLLKIRVADEYNRPIGTREAFIRNLGRFTFIPIFGSIILIIDSILILATDRQQRIGDRIAHTLVIKERPYIPYPPYYPGPYYAQQYYMAQNMPYYQHPPYQPSQPPYHQPPQQGYYQQPPPQPAPAYRPPPQEKEKE